MQFQNKMAATAIIGLVLFSECALAQQGWQQDINNQIRREGACDALHFAGQYCPQRSGQRLPNQIDRFGNKIFANAFELGLMCGFSARDGRLMPCPKLADTGGRGRIPNGEGIINISNIPYPTTMGDLLIRLPENTNGITLADRCN